NNAETDKTDLIKLVPRGGRKPLNFYEPNLGLKNSIEPFLKLTSH
ncbi:uncharacterized protein METZ01_LOCUS365972, partial [marine metagenome]